MAKIIKRNGKKTDFDLKKVRGAIKSAFEDAKLPLKDKAEEIEDLVKEVKEIAEEKGEIHAERIREIVLSRLDDIEPRAAEAWRRYDREKKSRE